MCFLLFEKLCLVLYTKIFVQYKFSANLYIKTNEKVFCVSSYCEAFDKKTKDEALLPSAEVLLASTSQSEIGSWRNIRNRVFSSFSQQM